MNSAVNYSLMTKLITFFPFNLFKERVSTSLLTCILAQWSWDGVWVGGSYREGKGLIEEKKTITIKADVTVIHRQIVHVCFHIWNHGRAREHICSTLCNPSYCTSVMNGYITLPRHQIQPAPSISCSRRFHSISMTVLFLNKTFWLQFICCLISSRLNLKTSVISFNESRCRPIRALLAGIQ